MESNGPPGPQGVYASLLTSQTRCPSLNEIPPYGSDVNFLVTGLILLSLPTVAKGFLSYSVVSLFVLCFARCRSINETPSLPQEGPSCHRLGNHWLFYPLVFATFAQVMM